MKQVAVVIPIYKESPAWNEEISFRQTMRVLGTHPIILVCPKGLDISEYSKMCAEIRGREAMLLCETFDPDFFKGIKSYNRLLLSESFYARFTDYEYILICQPDTYIFRDELVEWCKKGYDYIGAPLFGEFWDEKSYLMKGKVGNGGLSLRRIGAYVNYFNGKKLVIPRIRISKRIHFSTKPYTRWLVWLLMAFGWRNKPHSYADHYEWNEDVFWSLNLNGTNYEQVKPKVQEALEFAWERFPSEIYKHVGHLPMGCHAWEKYEYETFWKKYIY